MIHNICMNSNANAPLWSYICKVCHVWTPLQRYSWKCPSLIYFSTPYL